MKFINSILLASAIAVHEITAQPLDTTTTTSSATSSATPVCGQEYNSYDIFCGQTFGGETLSSAAAADLEDCTITCDGLKSCIAVSYLSGQCTLLSSVDQISNADGAQAALLAVQASTILPSIGSSVMASVVSSIAATAGAPTDAQTTSVPYESQISVYISAGLSANSPTQTGDDTQIYISPTATSAPSTSTGSASSSFITSAAALDKRATAASTCTLASVKSHTSIIRAAEASPVIFCENWNFNRPHSSTPFTKISYPPDVSNACSCILAQFAATTTCNIASVQTNMARVRSAVATPTIYCLSWIGDLPHSTSPVQNIGYPPDLTTACKCIIAGAAQSSIKLSSSSTTKSTSKKATSTTTSLTTETTGAYVVNTGKRGLAYNDVSLTLPFSRAGQNSRVSWAYNWYLSSEGTVNPALTYIPLLFNNDSTLTSEWSTAAQTAIDDGATALMSFNEPDWCASGSACMTIASAVKTYKAHMQPFAGKAKLGAPAVTNAGAPYGLTYLSEFIGNCTGCTIDFINLHWYSNKYAGATYFEEYINSARAIADGKPIWITEFGLDSTYSYTDSELQSFLETVMPWMDQQSDITHYAYFMDEAGILINSDGVGMSGTGAVFNEFVNSTTQANLY